MFRNRGRVAGASLPHLHSQVIATGMVPARMAMATAWARSHYERHHRCVTCETLEREVEDGHRIVEATERFVVLVPFAAERPFEQRIVPRSHNASFAEAGEQDLVAISPLLRRALRRIEVALGNPPYRYVVDSGPAADVHAPCMHWVLRIVPDHVRPGGFELSAGLPINPSRPEDDAKALRTASPVLGR